MNGPVGSGAVLALLSELVAATAAEARASIDLDLRSGSPWINAKEAADYLRCPLSRIRKLISTGELPAHRDGRRVLYHRDELDDFIRGGGACSP